MNISLATARLSTLAAALALGGCATQAPPSQVAARAPDRWQAPLPPSSTEAGAQLPHHGSQADLAAWWRQQSDTVLAGLIESAQAVSPTVTAAGSRIAQSRAERVAAGAALAPTLDAAASVNRQSQQSELPTGTTSQAALQASWEIDLFGANRAARDAAQARLDSARAGWHDARVSVAAEVANQYYGLRACEQLLAVAREDAGSRAGTARLTELTAKAGFQSPASLALARASAADGNSRAIAQRAACDINVKALVALTAIAEPALRRQLADGVTAAQAIASAGTNANTAASAGASTAPDRPASAPSAAGMAATSAGSTAAIHAADAASATYATYATFTAPPLAIAELPARTLSQRPDVYTAEREVTAASADVGGARAQRYPRLTLSGSVGVANFRASGENTKLDTWTIGPLAVTLPVFDGGRRRANVDAASARYDAAVANYRATVRQAVSEVEQALVNLDSTGARAADARTAMDGYRVAFVATEDRYRNGMASLLELEDARRTRLAAEQTVINLRRERNAAWVALYRAAGGGWNAGGDAATGAAAASASTSAAAAP